MRLSSLIGWTTLALVGVVFVLPVVLFCAYIMWIALWGNPRFAHNYFRDIVPISDVIASQRWSDDLCIYAIVALDPAAPAAPPVSRHLNARKWPFGWPDEWVSTPLEPQLAKSGDQYNWWPFYCATLWPSGISKRLEQALMTHGTYFSGQPQNQKFYIYAPRAGLAAYINYGD